MTVLRCLALLCMCGAVVHTGNSLVLTQESSSVNLPFEYPPGAPFFQLVAINEKQVPTPRPPLFQILRTAIFPATAKSGRGLFTVDPHSGALMLSPHRQHMLQEYQKHTFAVTVVATSSDHSDHKTEQATVVVAVTNDSDVESCFPNEHICFPSSDTAFQLPESIASGTYVGTLKPLSYSKLCPHINTSYAFFSEAPLTVQSDTGDLRISSALDFEKQQYYEWNVSCEVTSGSSKQSFVALVSLSVLDVDDSAPYPQNSTRTTMEFDADKITPGQALPAHLNVLDRDSSAVNNISVGLLDPLDLFVLRDPVLFHGVDGKHMLINTAVVPRSPFRFPGSSYNISVVFEDKELVTDEDNQVVFYITINNHSGSHEKVELPDVFEVTTTVFRHTSHHARVIQPMEVHEHEGYFFRLSWDKYDIVLGNRMFSVTPNTGIVYVRDEVSLLRYNSDVIRLNLTWRNKDHMDRQCRLLIRVLDSDPATSCGVEPGRVFQTCALHVSEQKCLSSCGRGAVEGYCQWRSHTTSYGLTARYATCTPHLATCPDGKCDELEQKDPLICPQDCATKVQGEAFKRASGLGIGLSAAPCVCDGRGTCTCLQALPSDSKDLPTEEPPRKSPRKQTKVINETVQATHFQTNELKGACGAGCTVMISIVSLVMACLISVAVLLVYRQVKGSKQKLFIASHQLQMTEGGADPDLLEDNDTDQTALQTPEDSASGTINVVEAKLEFPRDRLFLQETVGEGEFGKVVKARATNIADIPGTTTVAVKMLKEGASANEERDLISELNLLKDISHPNIIRLLGACTSKGGPLYVVVEYAEFGSLKSYLQRKRTSGCLCETPEVCPSRLKFLFEQELFSFSWQIAKGMAYLADTKLVHRDLAARNVLVARGKVIKISDFGLSRDIYVGDAYLKTTKSRVPVKWMAIESLADNVYTTKSDVWSFGIVLWEIINTGASPYPGVSPEKLYHLLREGYRMPKPANCSEELYRIMISCWKEKPQERPPFKELVQRLEAMLHDTVEYLSLGVENNSYDLTDRDQTASVKGEKKINTSEYSKAQLFSRTDSSYERSLLLPKEDYSATA